MSLKPKLKNIEARTWEDIREAWLDNVPKFSRPGQKPEPGLDDLVPLHALTFPPNKDRFPDVDGLRMNLLWEAIFLFHKCAHTHLAAQRLTNMGMQSWGMFNAYHSAYLGARGIMAALGVGLPTVPNEGQFLVDVYPLPATKKERKRPIGLRFQEILIVRLPRFEQRQLWETFRRVLRMSTVSNWNQDARQELLDLPFREIATRRNGFLYRAAYWPGTDLLVDEAVASSLLGTRLDEEHEGFLARLSCSVYQLFECLMEDLANQSGPIREQINESRIIKDPSAQDIALYNAFLAQVAGTGADAVP